MKTFEDKTDAERIALPRRSKLRKHARPSLKQEATERILLFDLVFRCRSLLLGRMP